MDEKLTFLADLEPIDGDPTRVVITLREAFTPASGDRMAIHLNSAREAIITIRRRETTKL